MSNSSRTRMLWQLAWIVPAVVASVALVAWLLTMGPEGSDISGPLSLLVTIITLIFGILTWFSQRSVPLEKIQNPGYNGLSKKLRVVLIIALCVVFLGAGSYSIWSFLNTPDIQVTDLIVVSDGEKMEDGGQATISIPGDPPQREKFSLIPTLTNLATVGDCAGSAQLQVKLVIDGVPGTPLWSFPDEEILFDLEGVARSASVLVTPYLQDSSCRVVLGVSKAVLHN